MPNNDYILRSDISEALSRYAKTVDKTDTLGGVLRLIVRDIPAADVAEVRHGHWVYKMRELIRYNDVTGTDPLGGIQTVTVKTHVRGPVPYCSLCNALAADSFLDYCPRCGAKMQGEKYDTE